MWRKDAAGHERVAQEDLPLLNDLQAALQHERAVQFFKRRGK